MLGSQRLREAELAFLNAPFEEGGWLLAIEQLAAITGSAVAQLCVAGSPACLPFNLFSDDRHDPYGHLVNPVLYGAGNWRIGVTGRPRTIQHERHYVAYRKQRSANFYDDAISDLDLPHGCQSALMIDPNGLTGLALLRSSRDGICTPDTLATFAMLARQAHRALRVQLALGEQAAELMIGGEADCRDCTILFDGHANILALTQAAELLFDEPNGLSLSGHQLRLANPAENHAFYAAVTRLLGGDGINTPIVHETRLGRSVDRPAGRWRAILVRLGQAGGSFGFEPRLALTLGPLPD